MRRIDGSYNKRAMLNSLVTDELKRLDPLAVKLDLMNSQLARMAIHMDGGHGW